MFKTLFPSIFSFLVYFLRFSPTPLAIFCPGGDILQNIYPYAGYAVQHPSGLDPARFCGNRIHGEEFRGEGGRHARFLGGQGPGDRRHKQCCPIHPLCPAPCGYYWHRTSTLLPNRLSWYSWHYEDLIHKQCSTIYAASTWTLQLRTTSTYKQT